MTETELIAGLAKLERVNPGGSSAKNEEGEKSTTRRLS